MSKSLRLLPDRCCLLRLLLIVLLVAAAGCSRRRDSSGEDSAEPDRRRTVISRDRRRETPAQPAGNEEPASEQKSPGADTAPEKEAPKPQPADPKAEMEKQAAQAARLAGAGMRLWDDARDAADKGEEGMADSLLMQAYSKLEEAQRTYADLVRRQPGSGFEEKLKEVEAHLYEAQKAIGTGKW